MKMYRTFRLSRKSRKHTTRTAALPSVVTLPSVTDGTVGFSTNLYRRLLIVAVLLLALLFILGSNDAASASEPGVDQAGTANVAVVTNTDITGSFTILAADNISAWVGTRGDCGDMGTECLPLWRWSAASPWRHMRSVARGVPLAAGFGDVINNLFMDVAGWSWWALRGLLMASTRDGWTNEALIRINEGFIIMYDFVAVDTPLLGIVLAIGLLGYVATVVKKGWGGTTMTQLITFVVPLAILFGFVGAARQQRPVETGGTSIERQVSALPMASPAGLAREGLLLADGAADNTIGRLNGLVTIFPGDEQGATTGGAVGTGTSLQAKRGIGCEAYVGGLYKKAMDNGADPLLGIVSGLWNESWLDAFYQTQYGDATVGRAIGCRLLETKTRGVDPAAQQIFAVSVAGGAVVPPENAFIALDEDDDDTLREVMSWGICTGPRTVVTQRMWLLASEADNADANCSTWQESGDWIDAEVAGGTKWDEVNAAWAAAGKEGMNRKQALTEFNTYLGLTGRGSQKAATWAAMMAMITGFVYLFTLGFLSLGIAVAGIIMLALLMVLPITLLALALPRTRNIGKKMANLTASSIFVKLAMTLLLGIMLFFIQISNVVLSSETGGNADLVTAGIGGSIGTIMRPIVPIVVWIILRKVLRKVGLGSLMTLKGSLGATGAIANKIGSSGKGGNVEGAAGRFGKKGARRGGRLASGLARDKVRRMAYQRANTTDRENAKNAKAEKEARLRAMEADPDAVEAIARESRLARAENVVAGGKSPVRAGDTASGSQLLDKDGNPLASEGAETGWNVIEDAKRSVAGKAILVGESGVTVPEPVLGGVNPDAPGHWVNYLPDELKGRRMDADGVVETEGEYADRLNAYGDMLAVQEIDGRDTWNALELISSADATAVRNGNLSPLDKVARFKVVSEQVQAAERGAGVAERFGTGAKGMKDSKHFQTNPTMREARFDERAAEAKQLADTRAEGRKKAKAARL